MNYQKVSLFDTANGPGIRTVLWVSGCNHYCKGCHNPDTWNLMSGDLFTQDTINDILDSLNSDYIAGLTVSGGDPLHYLNVDAVAKLLVQVRAKYPKKSIWLYTGFTWEEIIKEIVTYCDTSLNHILHTIDVLVDGKFDITKKDISLPYCGSTNQRIIDVQKSLKKNKVILYKEA